MINYKLRKDLIKYLRIIIAILIFDAAVRQSPCMNDIVNILYSIVDLKIDYLHWKFYIILIIKYITPFGKLSLRDGKLYLKGAKLSLNGGKLS